ncbi:MAG: glycerophosphodiester phosphodiesterase, partial [bacterium]
GPYFAPPRPRVFGHRGACGIAPENTLPSFALAAALGAGYLELDVHATSDGEIVVLHDPDLDRTTSGGGPVREQPWATVRQLDAGWHFSHDGRAFPYRGQGVRIPLLAEIVNALPAHGLNIEIKQGEPNIVTAVLDVLRAGDAFDRTLLAAEHDEIMVSIRAAVETRVATGMSIADVLTFFDRLSRDDWSGYVAPGRALQVPPAHEDIEIVTPAFVTAAHRVGLEVHVWTINDPAEIDRLLDLGVDGVMSDFPGLVASAVAGRR